jgi:hypothetical protein
MGIEQPDHLSRVSQDRFMVHLVVVDPHREGVWALNLDLLVPRQWFLHPEESGHGDLIPPAAALPSMECTIFVLCRFNAEAFRNLQDSQTSWVREFGSTEFDWPSSHILDGYEGCW